MFSPFFSQNSFQFKPNRKQSKSFSPVCLLGSPSCNIHGGCRRASCSCWSVTRSDPERGSRRADWDSGAIPNPDCRAAPLGSFLSGYHPSLVSVGAPPFLGRLKSKIKNSPDKSHWQFGVWFRSAPGSWALLRPRETILNFFTMTSASREEEGSQEMAFNRCPHIDCGQKPALIAVFISL